MTLAQLSLSEGHGKVKVLCFQWALPKGLHKIFGGGKGSSERAVMRGGGWFGKVKLELMQ